MRARVRPSILKADFGCMNLVCKVVIALDVRQRATPVGIRQCFSLQNMLSKLDLVAFHSKAFEVWLTNT